LFSNCYGTTTITTRAMVVVILRLPVVSVNPLAT